MAEEPALGFGELLRQLRAEARLTQEELADAASLSPRSVSDLERGVNRTARKDTAELLAHALHLDGTVRDAFVAAARGRAPAADVLAAAQRARADPALALAARTVWEGCPYLGLMPFEERDAKVFYGRGELVTQLVQRLADGLDQPGILLLTGESGAGKSSLLRAGLLPYLAAGALGPGSERWPRRVIRPSAHPLRQLATELAGIARTDHESVYRSLSAAPDEAPILVDLAVRAATGSGPSLAARDPADAAADAPRLVLVVDQLEELFIAGGDTDARRSERAAFIAALHAAATVPAGPREQASALVILAVRADFLGRLIAYPPLKAALDAGLFTVGAMSEAELRLAMTGPAAEAGLVVEPGVIEAVITELREGTWNDLGSGVLPLMSQAMAATWANREGTELTLRAYRRAGGVADAVNRSAQIAYRSLTSQQQAAARLVFTQLTTITPDGQFERRRCGRADLLSPEATQADITAVIDAFSAQRLLVPGADSIEISHDILLQTWKQLRYWLGDDQLDRALYGQVVTDAQTWDSSGRDPSYLYRPGRLAAIDAALLRWEGAPTRFPPLPATSQAFLQATHAAARLSARRRRSAFAILAVLAVLALVASGVAFYQRAAAVQQRDRAVYNQVTAEALQFGATDTSLAAKLDLAAYRIHPTQDLAAELLNTENTPLPTPLAADAGFVNSVAFSPDGRTLASGNSDGTVRLWNAARAAHPSPLGPPLTSGPGEGLPGGPGDIQSVAFSPDGHTLAAGSSDGTIRLWDAADPAHSRLLGPRLTAYTTSSIAFSPVGHLLAGGGSTTDSSGAFQLWNVADPAHPRLLSQILTGPGTNVTSVAFSPDGRTVAGAGLDGTLRLWDATNPARPHPLTPSLTGNTVPMQSVAFSRDGHLLAAGDDGGKIRLWAVTDPAHPRPLGSSLTGAGPVASVAFSPDGQELASGGLDGAILLWNLADPGNPVPSSPPFRGSPSAVDSVAFSPDGRTLASGSVDGITRLWSLPQTVITGVSSGTSNAVTVSPDGRTLASTDGGAVELRDVSDPANPQPLGRLPGTSADAVAAMAFSPAGHLLATGGFDGMIRLWDAADPAHPRPFAAAQAGADVPVSSVAFSPDGHTVASGNWDFTVRLWDVTRPAHPRPLGPILTATASPVYSVAFSPARHLLASGGFDGTIQLWDVTDPAEPRPVGTALLPSHVPVYSVAFSPDGRTLATGDYGGTIQLWDAGHPPYVRPLGPPLVGGGDQVNAVAFSPRGSLLVSGDSDGTIRLWNAAHPVHPQPLGQPLSTGTAPVDSVAVSRDGRTLAGASEDGTIRLWNLNVGYAIDRICATTGALTPGQWNTYIPQLGYQPSCAGQPAGHARGLSG